MASLNMEGPFTLSTKEIDSVVTETSAGNYALGYSKADGTFIVKYVGRSDTDLNARLKDWVGDYKQFKASYANSAQEAYKKELKNFNDFGGTEKLDNENIPDKP
ncbi:hypothetical protein [Ekhidna sp.]|uniref:hypothetical protein n=1 Tax=Ekhidna sp. TaxID=2608089 RepID=UPI0032EEFA58